MLTVRKMATQQHVGARLIVYDLGDMGRCQGTASPVWARFGIEHRHFDFDKYPSHVRTLQCYAWKAPIVVEVCREVGNASVVAWVDSGALVMSDLRSVVATTRRNNGFASDETAKSIARFSHELTLDFFINNYRFPKDLAAELVAKRRGHEHELDHTDGLSPRLASFKNCNGAFSAHLYGSRKYTTITERWLHCSLDKNCVCPRGSTRANHRQDQAALTLLAVMDDYVCGSDGKFVAAHGLRNVPDILRKFHADTFCGQRR